MSRLRAHSEHIFFPAIGVPGAGGRWDVDLHAWCFRMHRRRITISLMRKLVGLDRTRLTAAQKQVCAERARWLLVDDKRGRSISVSAAGEARVVGRTRPNGRLRATFSLEPAPDGRAQVVQCAVHSRLAKHAPVWEPLEVHFLEREGLSVVSDVDDTIRISNVGDRQALLRGTFLEPFVPVPGMADVYRAWAMQSGAQFHYVTTAPWQLFVPVADFIETSGFPRGTFHLKDFRWHDRTFFDLFAPPDRFKLATIEKLLTRLPDRRFVLVGDSGQRDPEVFGQLARRYPKQVMRVFIRDLGDVPLEARCRAAFADVDAKVWSMFSDASSLPTQI